MIGPIISDQPSGNEWNYAEWIRLYDTLTDDIREKLKTRLAQWSILPKISVLMPVYDPSLESLNQAIESVRNQLYPNWELCIADDASRNPQVREILQRHAAEDSRVHVSFRKEIGHISEASNTALELVSGEYCALMDHENLLTEDALFHVAAAIIAVPDVGIIYSDEDRLDSMGCRVDPYFKCDWNLDLFRSQNMISHLGVYRTGLLKEIGGFRKGFEGAQDYDLALRVSECLKDNQIVHIPKVLYHWRIYPQSTASAKSDTTHSHALEAGKRALNEHLQRSGIRGANAEIIPGLPWYRVHYQLPSPEPLVSLIIPTRNREDLVRKCVESILQKTEYKSYELIIVDNGSDDPHSLAYFEELKKNKIIRVLRDDGDFNYSRLNNLAVKAARGEIVGLINNDIEVISPKWLSEMVSIALQRGVGVVGARLWYPNDTLQHAGVIIGLGECAGHVHKGLARGMSGYHGRASLIQSFSAVTGACLIVRKSLYEEVNGLNEEHLKIAFNDVDFCLKIKEAGYRNVWTPYAELYHHESLSRGYDNTLEKLSRFKNEFYYLSERWQEVIRRDPAYNPNLSNKDTKFSLAWPPRILNLGWEKNLPLKNADPEICKPPINGQDLSLPERAWDWSLTKEAEMTKLKNQLENLISQLETKISKDS